MGDANLTRASELVFPQLVLTLFTNDILLDQLAAKGQSTKAARTVRSASGGETLLLAFERPVRVAQADLCTSVANFRSDTMTSKLNAPEVDWLAGFERLPIEPAPAGLCRR